MDTILTRCGYERRSLLAGKTTVVMATCQSRIECLMLSLFSLLLRSSLQLEHIIVAINGPDSRTGDPSLQDAKQSFLEELRDTRWQASGHDRDMPLTVLRTWSRIGHGHAMDAAIPWVHTELYTLMHDDVIVKTSDWCPYTFKALEDRKVGFVYAPPLLSTGLSVVEFNGGRKINLPHPATVLVSSRKELYTGMGLRWYGYHLPGRFDLQEADVNRLVAFHEPDGTHIPSPGGYDCISMDVGTWVYSRLKKAGYKFEALPRDYVLHLTAMSWRDEQSQGEAFHAHRDTISLLEREIKSHPPFARLYEKYCAW